MGSSSALRPISSSLVYPSRRTKLWLASTKVASPARVIARGAGLVWNARAKRSSERRSSAWARSRSAASRSQRRSSFWSTVYSSSVVTPTNIQPLEVWTRLASSASRTTAATSQSEARIQRAAANA